MHKVGPNGVKSTERSNNRLSELVDFGEVLEACVGKGARQLCFVEAFGGAELVEVGVLVAQHSVDAAE